MLLYWIFFREPWRIGEFWGCHKCSCKEISRILDVEHTIIWFFRYSSLGLRYRIWKHRRNRKLETYSFVESLFKISHFQIFKASFKNNLFLFQANPDHFLWRLKQNTPFRRCLSFFSSRKLPQLPALCALFFSYIAIRSIGLPSDFFSNNREYVLWCHVKGFSIHLRLQTHDLGATELISALMYDDKAKSSDDVSLAILCGGENA